MRLIPTPRPRAHLRAVALHPRAEGEAASVSSGRQTPHQTPAKADGDESSTSGASTARSSHHSSTTHHSATSSTHQSSASHSASSSPTHTSSSATSTSTSSAAADSANNSSYSTAVLICAGVAGVGILSWLFWCLRRRSKRKARESHARRQTVASWGPSTDGGAAGGRLSVLAAGRSPSISRSERRRGSRRLDDLVHDEGGAPTMSQAYRASYGFDEKGGGEKAHPSDLDGIIVTTHDGGPTYPPSAHSQRGLDTPITPSSTAGDAFYPPSPLSPRSPDPLLRGSDRDSRSSAPWGSARSPIDPGYPGRPFETPKKGGPQGMSARDQLLTPPTPRGGAPLPPPAVQPFVLGDEPLSPPAGASPNRISNGLARYGEEAPARAGAMGASARPPSTYVGPPPPSARSHVAEFCDVRDAPPMPAQSSSAGSRPASTVFSASDRQTVGTALTSEHEGPAAGPGGVRFDPTASSKGGMGMRKKDTIMGVLGDYDDDGEEDEPPKPFPAPLPPQPFASSKSKPPLLPAIHVPPASEHVGGLQASQTPSPSAVAPAPPSPSVPPVLPETAPGERPLSNLEDLLNNFGSSSRQQAAMSTAFDPTTAFRASAVPVKKTGHARGRSNSSSMGSVQPPVPIPAPPARLISSGHDPIPPPAPSRSPKRSTILSPVMESGDMSEVLSLESPTKQPGHGPGRPPIDSEYGSTRPFSSDELSIEAFDLERSLVDEPKDDRKSPDDDGQPEWLNAMLGGEAEPAKPAHPPAPAPQPRHQPPPGFRRLPPAVDPWQPRPGPLESQATPLTKATGLSAPASDQARIDSVYNLY